MGFILQKHKNICVDNSIKKTQLKLFIFLLFSSFCISSAEAIESQQLPLVKRVIEAFQKNDRVAISKLVSYPLLRDAPLRPINNPRDFLTRFDDVFDARLLTTIKKSNPYIDWDNIGWRGVILNNGIISLDPEGKITEINYRSQKEVALANKFNSNQLAKGRRLINRNIANLQKSIVEVTTERFHIRVDEVGNGKLRYASWPINKQNSQNPDLVISNGRLLNNGRNERFVFDNGTYSYQININKQGFSNQPIASLDVYKNGSFLARERAIKVIRH